MPVNPNAPPAPTTSVWDSVPATSSSNNSSNTLSEHAADYQFQTGRNYDEEDALVLPPPPTTFTGTVWQRTKKDPIVTLGFLATVGCLGYGVFSMGMGDKTRQQQMMRGRVAFQALTLAAVGWGAYKVHQERSNAHLAQLKLEHQKK